MTDALQAYGPPCQTELQLEAAGWQRRFIADPVRAKEATALYHSLGFEVHVEPLARPDLSPDCTDCQLVACQLYVIIYTRKRPAEPTSSQVRTL
jgi:hypothetical protein